jgi:hypothetical protein
VQGIENKRVTTVKVGKLKESNLVENFNKYLALQTSGFEQFTRLEPSVTKYTFSRP